MELSSEITGAIVKGHREPGVQVPITYVFLPEHNTLAKPLQACRGCLLTDCRLYSMEQCNLKEMFKQLIGLQLLDDKYPSSLCAECATFLIKCKRFREKSLRVQKTLIVLSNTARTVTCEQIKRVRKVKKLSSNLSIKKNCPNFYDTEIYVAEDNEEESSTNLKDEQIHIELTRDCVREIDSYMKSSKSLVKQNPPNNLDTDIYVCDDDEEEEEEILTSVKSEKIKTEERGFEANLAKRENMKLFSNSSVKQNPPNNFDTCIYVCDDDDDEETPVYINDKEIKTELISDSQNNVIKEENPPDCSDIPYITYTYENYEENKITTLKDNLLPIKLLSDSDENESDTIKTETNLEQVEVSKEIKEKNLKMESNNDGSKPATKTAKKYVKKVYNCKQCDKVLKSKPIYLAHLRSEHHSTQHVCCLCGLSFINKRCVREHKRIKHVIDNLHIPDDGPCCPECSLRFLSEEALQTHLQGPLNERHIPVTEFCDDLNAEISDSQENEECLKSEFESDGEDKVNDKKASTKIIKKPDAVRKRRTRKVPLDSKETVQKRLILKNMIAVKRLTLEEQLEVIQRRKENNQDKPHKCDICSFGTNFKQILETHMMRHSKEMGELSCTLCHFRFKTQRAYRDHKVKHTYMYSCVECPFTTYMQYVIYFMFSKNCTVI